MRTPPNERVSSDITDTPQVRGRKASAPGKSCAERRCILAGESASRDALIRLAISPAGDVLPDVMAKAPGRGAWIGVTRAELETAITAGKLKGALARAFKGAPLSVPDDLPQRAEDALRKTLLDRLGLEMRSGTLILGSDRIGEQARLGRISLLLHAADAREDGRKKLDQAWRVGRDAEGSGERGTTLPLDRAALSVALGRDNVVHLGVSGCGAAGRITSILTRLQRYIGVDDPAETASAEAPAAAHDDE
uniref:DUF448 domain-containing protein n=1 Tax=Parerythrobacter lutipelagi TaxID=1964208 RepID=UPI0010F8244A|nr:DUF448 domain-containing protein [Parerythrobacter lutipelagi]